MRNMLKVISDFFKIKCPSCNTGYLKNTGTHITHTYAGISVYTCNTCNKEFI